METTLWELISKEQLKNLDKTASVFNRIIEERGDFVLIRLRGSKEDCEAFIKSTNAKMETIDDDFVSMEHFFFYVRTLEKRIEALEQQLKNS